MTSPSLLRSLVLIAMVIGSVAVSPGVAAADDLDDYLVRAAEADYGGRRIIVTIWEGKSHAGIADIEHSGGMTMIVGESGDMMVGAGKLAGGGDAGIAITEWHAADNPDRYVLGEPERVTRIGRPALAVTILEGDLVRAKIYLDEETWAPLATEIFDGQGDTFRLAAFTDFDAHPGRVHRAMREPEEYDVATSVDASSMPGGMPHEVAGYSRVDVYDAGDAVRQGFYTDGLFSFSLFETDGAIDDADFEEAEELVVDDESYALIVDPAEIWVRWQNAGTSYVLVGNLPPDHLEDVLTGLPEPRNRGLLSRLWSDIFG